MTDSNHLKKTWDTYSSVNVLKNVDSQNFPYFDSLAIEEMGLVLDVGCGAGSYMKIFGEYAQFAVGVDISPRMLNSAKKDGHAVCQADFSDLPFMSEQFDLVYSLIAINYAKDWKRAISEISRVLKPDGTCLIVGANTYSILTPFRKIFHYIGVYQFGATYHTSPFALKKAGRTNGLFCKKGKVTTKRPPLGNSLKSILYYIMTRIDTMLNHILPCWGGDVTVLFSKTTE